MFATKLRVVAAVVACCALALACTVGAIHFANAQPTPDSLPYPLTGVKTAPDKPSEKPAAANAEKKLLTAIPLKKLDAKPTAEKLLKLLPAAVTVAAVRDENTLLVFATAKGTEDVRLVLRTLGEELPKEAAKPAEPKKYSFSFRRVPWSDVLDWYAKESGLTMITTVKPTGMFTCVPPAERQFTLAEITDLLNEALAQQKLILIRRPFTFFIHSADEKLDSTLLPRITRNELSQRGRTELVQLVLPSNDWDVDELKKFLTPFGSIVATKSFLVLQETAGNISRIFEAFDPFGNQPTDPRKFPTKPKTHTMKFEKTPWKDVFAWYAAESGLTQVGDALPTGTFTFTSPVPENPQEITSPALTLDEITDYINESLLVQKWLLVRGKTTFAVIPADEKIDPKWVTRIKADQLDQRGRTELVEVVIDMTIFGPAFRPLVPAADVLPTARRMLGPFGQANENYYTGSRGEQLLVRDTAENVTKIVKAIRAIEESESKKRK